MYKIDIFLVIALILLAVGVISWAVAPFILFLYFALLSSIFHKEIPSITV